MRAARIENGLVADLWEVPSLTAYASAGIELIAAPDNVGMGDAYANGVFTPKPVTSPTQAELTALAQRTLAQICHDCIPAMLTFIAAMPNAPAELKAAEASAVIERGKISKGE